MNDNVTFDIKYDNTKQIAYMSGYKYQLVDDCYHVLSYRFDDVKPFECGFIKWQPSILMIKKGYAWDGASGIAIDTKDFMRGSLVHDALYQCTRLGFIDISMRQACDEELKRICELDGMISFRANYVYDAVRMFGHDSAVDKKKVLIAP